MTIAIIISLCLLVLIAYLFDITASKTKVPTVILLLGLGIFTKWFSRSVGFPVPDLTALLPVLGTIGLILIVLEGSLELELNRDKLPLVKRSFMMALLPLLLFIGLIAFIVFKVSGEGVAFADAVASVIPLGVISSSVAIPSVRNFARGTREFVIYESSISDILGVVFFNFFSSEHTMDLAAVGTFVLQILIIVVISFVATIALSILLNRIEHPIKFVPIIMLTILIYEASKIFHLPSLVFIMVFGLFLGNIDRVNHIRWIRKLNLHSLGSEVHRFHTFVTEITFLARALFFILFGFLLDLKELLDTHSLAMSLVIVVSIFLVRWLFLKLYRIPVTPLIFFAPRGLITILLFLSLPARIVVPRINNAVLIQVIVLTAVVLMAGSLASGKYMETSGAKGPAPH